MNTLYFKYAVEVAKTKSISLAAKNLFMGQPNLSRAIKDMEDELGITIFKRNTNGISVTPDGERFLQRAKLIVEQLEGIENLHHGQQALKQRFSVCVPRASYISYALAEFVKQIDYSSAIECYYKETNSMRTINNIVREAFNLGIIRYQVTFDKYFKSMFQEKKIAYETICEFSYVLLTHKQSPLAKKKQVTLSDLSDYIEITHADPYVPNLPQIDVKKAELSEHVDKYIFLFERASQFVLLENVPNTFMWVSSVPQPLLEKYNLIQIPMETMKTYKDVLIRLKSYQMTELDDRFLAAVGEARRKYM